MKYYFIPSTKPSNSLKALGKATSIPIITGKHTINRQNNVYLYWGRSISNKLEAIKLAQTIGLNTPSYYLSKAQAKQYLKLYETSTIFCRTLLNAHSGKGIVIATKPEEVVDAPLYTVYVKKKAEFRVHFFMGQPFDIQIKRKKTDKPHSLIRSNKNGYVFCRDIEAPLKEKLDNYLKINESSFNTLLKTTQIGDFCAVDLIYNEFHDQFCFLEVNATPGLENTTLENYKNIISKWQEKVNSSGMLPAQIAAARTMLRFIPTDSIVSLAKSPLMEKLDINMDKFKSPKKSLVKKNPYQDLLSKKNTNIVTNSDVLSHLSTNNT